MKQIKQQKYVNVIAAVAGFGIVISAMNFTPAGGFAKNLAYSVSSPMGKMFWSSGAAVSRTLENISAMQNAVRENANLKNRNTELAAEIIAAQEARKENETLKEALGLGLDKEFDLKMASVIGKDISQDSLLIDKGADDMVELGLPVITSNKVVVGRVVKVYRNFSKVELITGKESSFDAKIMDGEIDGLAKGQGGLKLIFDLVAKDKEIRTGMTVSTSSLGGLFPKGLLVGTIGDVDKSDVETFQRAAINPAFEIKNIDTVFVVAGYRFLQE